MIEDQRYIISARIVGGVLRDKPKLKMFMVSVMWSDETEIIIYRSFQDFKTFHKQLKKRFPNLKPFRKNDRVIPKFNGKARRSKLQQKGSKKSVRQMKFLESYSEKLLKCEQTVTCSSDVTRFFTPKDHDVDPEFTKNAIMILMSDDLQNENTREGAGHFTGNVTRPFVTQTYRCVAAYETKDTKNRPFKVAVDETLDVLIKDPAGWWLVENENKRLAWFPAPYLEMLDEEDENETGATGGTLYCAVRSYSSKKHDEISVPIGSVVEVLRKSEDGWWLIRFNGKAGYIPTMYLQPYTNPRAGLLGLHTKLHNSTLNLATRRNSSPPRTMDQVSSERAHRNQPEVPARIKKAQSLDVLSETWLQNDTEDDTASDIHRRSSTNSTFSGFSSDSESSTDLKEDSNRRNDDAQSRAGSRQSSNATPDCSSSVSCCSSETPRVPPRPKTEEILTRCSTMTRKAALATKTRLQIQPDATYSR